MTVHPLPRPATAAECYLAAVVDRLDQLNAAVAELNGRLGPSTQPPTGSGENGGSKVRVLEPDPGMLAAIATGPVQLREPEAPDPPRFGKGSGRDAWAARADRLGVKYPANAGQRDIIAAIDNARRAAPGG